MKFLQKILIVALSFTSAIIPTETAYTVNQITIFNTFANESWKSDTSPNIAGVTGQTVEQHLVQAFNAAVWIPGAAATKINQQINNNVMNYYAPNGRYQANNRAVNNQAVNNNPQGWVDDIKRIGHLCADDSPRQWMDKLDLREIYRFKELVIVNPQLVDNAKYATDDLVKARSLCGTFWEVDTNNRYPQAARAFSGMLVPGQRFTGEKQVYTCVHGFISGNSLNKIAYYFVPYGVKADGTFKKNDKDNPDFVTLKGFKVTSVDKGRTRAC
jgi:hypothetical protein